MRDDILITLFGGGIADYDMLDSCNYEFEDILGHIRSFTTIDDMDFNDILLGAIDEYRSNLQKAIDDKIKEVEFDLNGLEDYADEYNGDIDKEYTNRIVELRKELEDLRYLDTWEDIEYNTNCLDTDIWFKDDETKEIYSKYLEDEIKAENKKIGFVELDLD